MHVALLSAEYPPRPGGVGDYTRQLGMALVQRGLAVTVLTSGASAGHGAIGAGEPSIFDLHIPSWDWRCWRAVMAALDRLRPDVLHIQYQTGAYGMHPAINLLPWRLRRRRERPGLAVTAHDLLLPYLLPKAAPLRRWVTHRLLSDVDAAVVTNTEDYAGAAKRTGGARGPVLIPIGSNIPVAPPPDYDRVAWRARLGVAEGDLLIAYFGLISRSKGLDVVLAALSQLPPAARLLVIGGEAMAPQDRAYAAEVMHQIDRAGLHERVSITGYCAEADVSAHLLAADVAALPFTDGASFRRGSLLAALTHGVPTITTRARERGPAPTAGERPAQRDVWLEGPLLVDAENVLLVPPGDAGAVVRAIERLARDAGLRERLRAEGQRLARQFTWEVIAGRHVLLYGELT